MQEHKWCLPNKIFHKCSPQSHADVARFVLVVRPVLRAEHRLLPRSVAAVLVMNVILL
jgi:hypothetical protein